MTPIHENLKILRLASGLSQTEVADAINVTRQTVSSYETGRTQPDLETLKRLSELYEADLHDVLYGGNRLQHKIKLIRRVACVISAVLLLSLLAHSALFWVNNTFFPVETGATTITDETRGFFEARFALRDSAEKIASIGTGIFFVGCLVLCPLVTMEKTLPIKMRIVWLLGFIIAAFAVVVPFILSDKTYRSGDYLFPVWSALPSALLVFFTSVAADMVRRIKTRRKRKA